MGKWRLGNVVGAYRRLSGGRTGQAKATLVLPFLTTVAYVPAAYS